MKIENVSFSYGDQKVLDNISLIIKKHQITTLMGANGCGKTTLFNVMTKNLQPQSGSVYLGDRDIKDIKLKHFAKKVSIVHQYNTAWSDMTVEKLVSYGRVPYIKMGKGQTGEDRDKITWAMEVTGISPYKNQLMGKLSGGQKQRVWIAMALAQNTQIIFLDEPTTYLDIRYQVEILHLIKDLNRKYKITIIMVLHDINQAIHFSHEIIGLKDGKVAVCGKPQEVLKETTIELLYGIKLKIAQVNGNMMVLAV